MREGACAPARARMLRRAVSLEADDARTTAAAAARPAKALKGETENSLRALGEKCVHTAASHLAERFRFCFELLPPLGAKG